MIRLAGAAVGFLLAAGPAAADRCSLMLSGDDLPNCIRDLNSKIFILQAQLQAEQAKNRLNSMILCSLALSLNKAAPSQDVAETAQNACESGKEAAAERAKQKAKATRP